MPGPYDAGNSITSGSPLGPQQPLGPPQRQDQGLPQQALPGIEELMQDPKFAQYLQAAKQKKKTTLQDLLNGQGTIQELAAAFPKIEQIMQNKKLVDAKKKVEDIKLEQLHKKSQMASEAQQAQQQSQQQQS
jgi:hypothetical protein